MPDTKDCILHYSIYMKFPEMEKLYTRILINKLLGLGCVDEDWQKMRAREFWEGDRNILKLDCGMVAQVYKCTKYHQTVHL
jgi:hypothetical protein